MSEGSWKRGYGGAMVFNGPTVRDNGSSANVIDAGLSGLFVSTGLFNYSQTFASVFVGAPSVVITLLNPSTGGSTFLYLVSVTNTLFNFVTGLTTPVAVFPVGATFQIEWIAVGS